MEKIRNYYQSVKSTLSDLWKSETVKDSYQLVKNLWTDFYKAAQERDPNPSERDKDPPRFLRDRLFNYFRSIAQIYRVLHLLWPLPSDEFLYGLLESVQP